MKKSANDEPMHSKKHILEYHTTSLFGFPRNVLTVHQDVDESKLDPKSSNRTDFYAEGLDKATWIIPIIIPILVQNTCILRALARFTV